MKSFFFFLFITLAIWCIDGVSMNCNAQCSNVGNDFWTGFPEAPEGSSVGLKGGRWLFATTTLVPTSLTVETSLGITTYPIGVGQVTAIKIPDTYIHVGTGISNKFIHVYTADKTPFVLYTLDRKPLSTDGATCIPTDALGTEYFDASIPYSNSKAGFAEFMIIPTEDSTVVSFVGPNVPAKTIVLNKGQTYQHTAAEWKIDIAGTSITSNKPIAVITGNWCAAFNGSSCDHIYEHLQPTESWGRTFLTSRLTGANGASALADIVRVFAEKDATQIFVNGVLKSTINRGKFYEHQLTEKVEIYATKPVQVAQYTAGPHVNAAESGDPAMLIIPSISQYISKTTFAAPTDVDAFTTNFLDVIVPTKYITNVQLDGVPIPLTSFTPIPKTYAPIEYSIAHVSTIPGSHTLTWIAMPPDSEKNTLCAYLYGWSRADSYAYTPGFASYPGPRIAMDTAVVYDTLDCSVPYKDSIVTIKNTCYQELKISGMTIEGVNANSFSVVSPTTFPVVVKEFDFTTCTVRFQPVAAGLSVARLVVRSNDGNRDSLTVGLSGFMDGSVRFASAPSDVNYGTVLSCLTVIDTVITVRNIGACPFSLTDTGFSQNNGLFEILSPSFPVTVAPGTSVDIIIRFHAGSIPVGSYSSTLTIVGVPSSVTHSVIFKAERHAMSYVLTPTTVDLGILGVGTTASGSSTLTNNNPLTVRVSDATFETAFPGSITTTFPQYIGPNGNLTITAEGSPTQTGSFSSQVKVVIDSPCAGEKFFAVMMEATTITTCPVADSLDLKKPGDEGLIPIVLKNTEKVKNASQVDVSVVYDVDLLRIAGEPIAPSYGTIENYKHDAGQCSFTLKVNAGQQLPGPDATLGTIPVTALLASKRTGEVRVTLSTVTQAGRTISSGSCPSPFTLGNGCVNPDGLRTHTSAMIEGIYPNPTESGATIVINAYGIPHVLIDVFDTFGRKVETVADGPFTSGKHEITLDAARYSNGIYFCRMIAGGIIVTKEFNVRK